MELLQDGLAVPGVRDRKDLAERLADLYQEQGRGRDKDAATIEIMPGMNVVRIKNTGDFGEKGLPLDRLPALASRFRDSPALQPVRQPKIGRNDPCPCGSGKKYKKCCAES